ncbi:alpha/beta hydrolase [Pseudaminobacter salicylatoxidans]|uniref:alpha/beta hydrolase n=1 Tax=Pseudaminobacter salicylatoxidans TaxID=93369 RepID=UPI0002F1339B|nr:alpha/beta hydrolase [Pseudaminobacter salicylatoxidans]
MSSLKSRLVALFLKHSRKKAFASPENLKRWIAASRRTGSHEPPARFASRFEMHEHMLHGFPVYEVVPRQLADSRRILYLHGGAYCFEITNYHWLLIGEMAERLGMRTLVPIYPIAPEHDFNAMFGMVLQLYRDMLRETAAENIIFMGDSAGGNMAVVMTMMAALEGLPSPGCHVLISPGVDMTLRNDEVRRMARQDPWLDIPGGLEAIRLYAPGMERSDWRISPLYGDLSVLPRTLLLTGTRDMLTPDNVIFAQKARAAGVEIDLVVAQDMFHVWPLVDMPEGRRARDRIVAYLRESGDDARRALPQSLPVSRNSSNVARM